MFCKNKEYNCGYQNYFVCLQKKNLRKKFRYSVFVEEKNLNSSFLKDKDEGSFYDLPRRNMVLEIEIYVQTYVYLFLIYSHYVLFRE